MRAPWRVLVSDGAGLEVVFSVSHLTCAVAAYIRTQPITAFLLFPLKDDGTLTHAPVSDIFIA